MGSNYCGLGPIFALWAWAFYCVLTQCIHPQHRLVVHVNVKRMHYWDRMNAAMLPPRIRSGSVFPVDIDQR